MLCIKGMGWSKLGSLLVVPLEKALYKTLPSSCLIQLAGNHYASLYSHFLAIGG